MNLYTVCTDYIEFLKMFQSNVWINEENFRLRPYVGVVLGLSHCNYFAPLSSPKPKHQSMKDRLDFIRLEHRGQLRGVVNLNNMIPVKENIITRLVIEDVIDQKYKNLLQVEMIDIRRKQKTIKKNAQIIYKKVTQYGDELQNAKLVSICYDFLLLEQKLFEYLKKDR